MYSRAVSTAATPVVANGLGDGQDVCLSEGAPQRGSAVSAGAEGDPLIGVRHVRPAGIVLALEPGQIDQDLFGG